MAEKILIVDDEKSMQELIELRFRREIRKGEYEFRFAQNGMQALQILEEEPEIGILLCDINMPEMNGLLLLEKIKALHHLYKVIMVTAYGNMGNIRSAMNGGAFDFLTKPIDFSDLKLTVGKALKELHRQQEGEDALRQLPITELALEETDQKARQLEELDRMKSRFFTNISHEFRTPLTVIKGMIDQLQANPTKWLEKGSQMIKRNTHQLLDLVNQVLDLRKLEAGQLRPRLIQADIIFFLRYLLESFHSLAEMKEIELKFSASSPEIQMDYDPEKMLRIISNLLSNAIKFTPEGGRVSLLVREFESSQVESRNPRTHELTNYLTISVSDTGIGIPKENIPNIFDRFYQVDDSAIREGEGTGIGLSLTQELVRLLGGSIHVESEPGKGSTFHLQFPITKTAQLQENPTFTETIDNFVMPVGTANPSPQKLHSEENLPRLLIIEDSSDVVEYLISCLEEQYELLIARNGQEGIDMALEHIPDLIVSDVMMPQKDGFEVCQTLKLDDKTSHIPIVLLTAKADYESRITGLKRGADAYLAKPFEQEELLIRLQKLLELRQRLQARYSSGETPPPSDDPATRQEDEFIARLRQAVESHLDDSTFGTLELCQHIGLSRSQLYYKLKALTGRSIAIYIRFVRLQKAREMLNATSHTISEIAYLTGFNDPNYFSRVFSKEFGMAPGALRG